VKNRRKSAETKARVSRVIFQIKYVLTLEKSTKLYQ